MTSLQKRLFALSRSLGVSLTTLEKDVALGALLAAIAADPRLARTLVFKGGTALKRLYFGDAYRFSEDLDFSAIDALRGANLTAALGQARAHAVEALSTEGPFDATLEPLRVRDAHPRGQDAFVIRFRFPWQRNALCAIKVEVTHDEPVLLPPERRPILPGSGLAPAGSLLAYPLEEVVSEKLRALLQTDARLAARGWSRPRARDYFDLWKILTAFAGDVDPATVRRILPAKCAHRDVSFTGTASFFTDRLRHEARRRWVESLADLVPELPPVERVLDELPPLVERLLRP
jgi:uncharacterized protein